MYQEGFSVMTSPAFSRGKPDLEGNASMPYGMLECGKAPWAARHRRSCCSCDAMTCADGCIFMYVLRTACDVANEKELIELLKGAVARMPLPCARPTGSKYQQNIHICHSLSASWGQIKCDYIIFAF